MIPNNKLWSQYKHLTYHKHRMVGEHKITMPDLPQNPKDVYFIDKDSEDAFWNRDEILEEYREIWFMFLPHVTEVFADATLEDEDRPGFLKSVNNEDTLWIDQKLTEELRRRRDGIFIKIKDEIIWITGDMYFVLMWCKTKRPPEKGKPRLDYFDFRFFQLDFCYLVHHTYEGDNIDGLFISKPKKTGITNLMWLIYLNRATMIKNINLGAMNIDAKKAAKTFVDYFIYAYDGLPEIIRPKDRNKSYADGSISFGKRVSSRKSRDSSDELGTNVMCVACKNNAFDVDVFYSTWFDEAPKYETDFETIFETNKSATKFQDVLVGKIFITSYTPEDSSKSFISAAQLFRDSELRTAEGRKSTKSGLICYHIPSHKSWSSSFDKYGYCNEKDAISKIMEKRAAFKDNPKQLQGEIRKYAIDKKEAWSMGGAGSIFDPIRLGHIMDIINEEKDFNPRGLGVKGNLKWVNESWNINRDLRRKGELSKVYFEPLTDEEIENEADYTFMEYYPIPPEQRNIVFNYGKDEWGNWNAPPVYMNIIGADPTQHAAGSEVIEGSKNSYVVIDRKNDLADMRAKNGVGSRRIMMEYHARPESPDDSFDDLLKFMVYTGALSAIEANAPSCATRMISEGMGRYMIVKGVNSNPVIWDRWMGMEREDGKQFSLLRATSNNADSRGIKEEFVRLHKAYIREPKGGSKDYGSTIRSVNYINDLLGIDIDKSSKKFDTFMSMGWCLWADYTYDLILMYDKENSYSDIEISDIFKALSA